MTRSRTTRTVREIPYFDSPYFRALWLTSTSLIATPCSLAMAGRNRCISPYSFSGLITSARNTFSEHP